MRLMNKIPFVLIATVLVGYASQTAAAGSAKIHDPIKNEGVACLKDLK